MTRRGWLAVMLIAAIARGQAAQTFGEAIEVSVTNVEVVVTDRSGAHVRRSLRPRRAA